VTRPGDAPRLHQPFRPSALPPLTSLAIALFDACSGGASRLAESLSRTLAESGIDARVMAFDAVTPNLRTAEVSAVFLRGLGSSARAGLSLQAADDSLRAALSSAGAAYQVLYGSDAESMAQVLGAIQNPGTARSATAIQSKQEPRSSLGPAPWVWLCDKCSDPQCEHRLLTALLEQRQTGISP
jgi:hypothetical protein